MALLGGCGTVKSWFTPEETPPLPGERISVLLHAQSLVPDPKFATERILLPRPTVHPDWPPAGGPGGAVPGIGRLPAAWGQARGRDADHDWLRAGSGNS